MIKFLRYDSLLIFARTLIFIELAAILISTAVAVGVEFAIYLLFILSGELRRRFVASFSQPMVLMSMGFYAMVTAGLFYGIAPREEGFVFWAAWRKLLLVPMAVSIFNDPCWKQRLAIFFIGFSSLAAMISIVSVGLDWQVYHKFPVGIVLDNHATQSMAFSLAIFCAGILLRFFRMPKTHFGLTAAGILVMTVNLIFITPGRSGYLAFLVFGLVTVLVAVQGKIKYLLVLILPVLVGSLLMASPVARQKIALGLSEITSLDRAEKLSSMGIRMVMWKNTVGILKNPDFPILTGYGTGSFREAYRPQVAGQTGWKAEVVGDCHNQYLRIAVEQGTLGLLLFFGFAASCFMQTASSPFKIMGIGALLAWCATSLFSAHFSTFIEGRLIYIWLGVMLANPHGIRPLNDSGSEGQIA